MKQLLVSIILMITTLTSWATTFSDLKFSQYQIADSQWDTDSCLNSNSCTIYQTNPGTMYNIPWWNGQWQWQSGQYVKFVMSGISGYPYTANVYNSDNSLAGSIGSGKIINMGVDANGYALFFFVGTDDNTGQLFSTNYGLTGNSGYSWTGTLNPTISQVDTFASSYGSTSPLSPGQTYSGTATPPPGPAVEGGTITQSNAPSNQIITSGTGSTAGLTQPQQTKVDTWTNGSQNYNNELYIEQTYGANNTVMITQTGNKNRIDFLLEGNGNVVTSTQTGNNYLKMDVPGWGNSVTTTQANTTGTNYAETKIQGNGNTVNHQQNGTGNHILFSSIAGDSNTVTSTQSGNSGHFLGIKLTGNWNSVNADQSGNLANKANIDLTNGGGAATLDLQQTGGKSFTIIQTCTNPAGCNTTVRQ